MRNLPRSRQDMRSEDPVLSDEEVEPTMTGTRAMVRENGATAVGLFGEDSSTERSGRVAGWSPNGSILGSSTRCEASVEHII